MNRVNLDWQSARKETDLPNGEIRADPVAIESLEVSAFKIPAATPESDGTYEWDSTTIVIVKLAGGGEHGLGYTYAILRLRH